MSAVQPMPPFARSSRSSLLRSAMPTFFAFLPATLVSAALLAASATAAALQPVAQVRTLGLVEVLFSYAVSRRVFRERLTRLETAGLSLVFAGLVGICLSLE